MGTVSRREAQVIRAMGRELAVALAVQMSPEVEEALGPEMAAQARATTGGQCAECREPLGAGPANVVLGLNGEGAGGIWLFAHETCAPSRIVPLTAEQTAALVQPEDGYTMLMTAHVVEDQAVLVAELALTPYVNAGGRGSEVRSVFMQVLLQHGLHLVTGPLDAPPLGEWVAVIQPRGRDLQLTVLTPEAKQFFHGTLAKPPTGWVRKVLAQRQVLLLGGDVGMSRDTGLQEGREVLAAAASAGQLAGARIRCGRPSDYGLT